jgi:hypothetical protein
MVPSSKRYEFGGLHWLIIVKIWRIIAVKITVIHIAVVIIGHIIHTVRTIVQKGKIIS